MPLSSFSQTSRPSSGTAPAPLVPAAPWQVYGQPQQQPNQGPAGTGPASAADHDTLDLDEDEAGTGDNDDPPAAATSTADPLRAERRRSNQLEKELRKARAQLSRFSEINPDEYARLQQAEQEPEQRERQWGQREQELNDANRRRVLVVEKERDEARQQVQGLRKERQLERLFSDAQGRVGGDETGTFFDTFVTLCGQQFRLAEGEGREGLIPLDGKGQPLTRDGVAVTGADRVEELRRHPVYSFLFQQRSGLYPGGGTDAGVDHGQPASLQSMSTRELYLEAMRSSSLRLVSSPISVFPQGSGLRAIARGIRSMTLKSFPSSMPCLVTYRDAAGQMPSGCWRNWGCGRSSCSTSASGAIRPVES